MKKNLIPWASAVIATLASLSSCEKAESSAIPHIASLTLSTPTLTVGEKGEGTLTFDQRGANVKGTYRYTITPGSVSGTFTATPTGSCSFEFDTPTDAGTYTIKVACSKMELYSGTQLYYQGSLDDIGSATATFTLISE